ncbi:MAG: DegT/DnrJ/EryC1/StrS family aminotransferase, partial [Melioribacteraceae bacterium]|nr:DegT/DnrJ/EryC1/StrS family aminotransferase [Melioribacteraceae bacterium]
AKLNQKMTGSFGHINATSFYPGKNLGALGEAGAITTDNKDYYHKVKVLRNYGSEEKYYNSLIGYNARIDECQASVLKVKLKYLNNWNDQRKCVAENYHRLLKDIKYIQIPHEIPDSNSVWHQYVIQANKRDELQFWLNSLGIETLIHYPVPPFRQLAFKDLELFQSSKFPLADKLANHSLSLPIYPGLTFQDQEYIASKIYEFYTHNC